MKLTITLVNLLIIAAGPALAGEVVVQSNRKPPALEVVNNAFESCATAFVARLFPGQQVKFRSELNVDTRMTDKAATYAELIISMQAHLKRDGSQLASGSCTVRNSGRTVRVTGIAVGMAPGVQLAGLKFDDVKFAVAGR